MTAEHAPGCPAGVAGTDPMRCTCHVMNAPLTSPTAGAARREAMEYVGRERVNVRAVFLMYAFRYALGRMTYAVGDVADALESNVDKLTPDWREQIIRDIGEAIADNRAGMSGDVERWTRCAEVMAEANAKNI